MPAIGRRGMGEIVLVLCVVGIVVLISYPLLRARRRRPADQPAVTDRDPMPPRRPAGPVPGSQADREQKARRGAGPEGR
jgi:hypothetical protein